jgi:meso-butanediol dehydrogenase / (S,S)-butanediol dehydrogenase / diacetyl reductase
MATGLLTDKVGFLRVAAENTARELETKSLVIECDVSQWDSVNAAIQATLQPVSRIDAVHNNAGISGAPKAIHDTSLDEWDQVMDVNLKSMYLTTRATLPALKVNALCPAAVWTPALHQWTKEQPDAAGMER